MRRLLKTRWALPVYLAADVVAVGLGMGVPFFSILLGISVGFVSAWRASRHPGPTRAVLGRLLAEAALTCAFTFVMMVIVWGRVVPMLFDPSADLANFGIPMILYEPRASFIGWLVLMIVISPFLQLLTTVFAGLLALAVGLGPQDHGPGGGARRPPGR